MSLGEVLELESLVLFSALLEVLGASLVESVSSKEFELLSEVVDASLVELVSSEEFCASLEVPVPVSWLEEGSVEAPVVESACEVVGLIELVGELELLDEVVAGALVLLAALVDEGLTLLVVGGMLVFAAALLRSRVCRPVLVLVFATGWLGSVTVPASITLFESSAHAGKSAKAIRLQQAR